MATKKPSSPSKQKARKILRDGKVHGKALTSAQRRFFGRIVDGGKKR